MADPLNPDSNVPPISSAARDAAAKWLARGTGGRKRCIMSPMDESVWFQDVRITTLNAIANTGDQLVVDRDPLRVGLILSVLSPANSGIEVQFSPLPTTGVQAVTFGLTANASVPNIFITQAEWGPMCSGPWYVTNHNNSGNFINAMELLLKDWPR